MSLPRRFSAHWKDAGFIKPGENILLGCSAGVDSTVLAHLLAGCRVPFAIAHFNYGLRGEDSIRDEEAVRELANTLNVPFHRTGSKGANEPVLRGKAGVQEEARALRYEWFENLCRTHRYSRIATAHHADDVAETVLINLFRGTGVAGLHGIVPLRGKLIRPLLPFTKNELLRFAEEQAIAFREDRSNRESVYTRNKIRLNILPVIEKHFPQAVSAIAGTAGRVQSAEHLLNKSYEDRYRKLAQQRGQDIYLPVKSLVRMEERQYFLHQTLQPLGFSSGETEEVEALLAASSGKKVCGATHSVLRHGDFLIIAPNEEKSGGIHYIDALPAELITEHGIFRFSIAENDNAVLSSPNIAHLSFSALEFPLILRRRRDGDYFYPFGMGGKKKKIGRFLSDLKVPAHHRENLWVLQSGERIAWLAGYRIDERFKVKEGSGEMVRVALFNL